MWRCCFGAKVSSVARLDATDLAWFRGSFLRSALDVIGGGLSFRPRLNSRINVAMQDRLSVQYRLHVSSFVLVWQASKIDRYACFTATAFANSDAVPASGGSMFEKFDQRRREVSYRAQPFDVARRNSHRQTFWRFIGKSKTSLISLVQPAPDRTQS